MVLISLMSGFGDASCVSGVGGMVIDMVISMVFSTIIGGATGFNERAMGWKRYGYRYGYQYGFQ